MKQSVVMGIFEAVCVVVLVQVCSGSVKIEPMSVVVTEGTSFTFNCSGTGKVEAVEIQYGGNSMCSKTGPECVPSQNGPDYILSYTNTANRKFNNGSWVCKLDNKTSDTARLEVKYPPKITAFKVVNGSDKKQAIVNITVRCEVDGHPNGNISIVDKDNNTLQKDDNAPSISLTIRGFKCRYTRKLTCRAHNDVGKDTFNLLAGCKKRGVAAAKLKRYYIGGAVGVVVLILLVAGVIVLIKRCKAKKGDKDKVAFSSVSTKET